MLSAITVFTSIGDFVLNAQSLAALMGETSGSAIVETALTTVGAGTMTGAALVGGQIARTGPTGPFIDTTDTAANIIAALGGDFIAGEVFQVRYKNATTWPATLAAGAGVTMATGAVVLPLSLGSYYATVGGTAASPTVTFKHIGDFPIRGSTDLTNPQATALNTVGAGTILAAGVATGTITRGGVQIAAFADTLDTAANMIAGVPALGLAVGASVKLRYVNNTIFPATITSPGGTVILVGQVVVPANSWVEYLVNQSVAGTVTLTAIGAGYFPIFGTAVANGATPVAVANTAVTAGSIIVLTLKTTGGTPHGAFVSAITPGTGFSINSLAGDTSTYNYEIRG